VLSAEIGNAKGKLENEENSYFTISFAIKKIENNSNEQHKESSQIKLCEGLIEISDENQPSFTL
jgi:hypothetical protein